MSKASGGLRADLSQFRELAAFAQFGSDLDPATQRQLARGERLMELLKQPQYSPIRLDHEVFLIYAGTRGFLDNVNVSNMSEWKRDFMRYMDTSHPDIGRKIMETGGWNDAVEGNIRQAIEDFMTTWSN
jgi:F-type H+-transporting ATPase subunit alpha